jgi:UDP-glucose 4-epimerase
MEPRRVPRSGYGKDVAEVEGYVRGFARRRPDVRVALLRAANVIGPDVHSPLASYFRLPVIPTVLGHDPRRQFLHERDLLGVLGHAVAAGVPGTFNIAGDGLLTLSQLVRRLQRPTLPLPGFALGGLGSVLRSMHVSEFSPELRAVITFGRGVDTTRMRRDLGFEPRYSTAAAVDDFASNLVPTGGRTDKLLADLERRLEAAGTSLESGARG